MLTSFRQSLCQCSCKAYLHKSALTRDENGSDIIRLSDSLNWFENPSEPQNRVPDRLLGYRSRSRVPEADTGVGCREVGIRRIADIRHICRVYPMTIRSTTRNPHCTVLFPVDLSLSTSPSMAIASVDRLLPRWGSKGSRSTEQQEARPAGHRPQLLYLSLLLIVDRFFGGR